MYCCVISIFITFTVVCEPRIRENIATIGETSKIHGGVPSGTPDSYSG